MYKLPFTCGFNLPHVMLCFLKFRSIHLESEHVFCLSTYEMNPTKLGWNWSLNSLAGTGMIFTHVECTDSMLYGCKDMLRTEKRWAFNLNMCIYCCCVIQNSKLAHSVNLGVTLSSMKLSRVWRSHDTVFEKFLCLLSLLGPYFRTVLWLGIHVF